MTATLISPCVDYGEAAHKSRESLNCGSGISGPQLTSGSSASAAASLLDGKAGASAPAAWFQRRHSVSLPSAKFSQVQFSTRFKTDPSGLPDSSCSGNKENRVRERSYSELRDRLRPVSQVCLGGSSQVNSSRYKTELCRPFEESGACKYGDKCQFAHGMQELRSLSRHPKYKTELCRTFHTSGFCPYGPRCHFIHNAEERCGPPPLSAFNKMARPRLQHSFSFAGFPSGSGSQHSPTSVTPPPTLATGEMTEWQRGPFAFSSQELAGLFGPSSVPPAVSEPQGLVPTPTTACLFQPTSESPLGHPDSLADQEGYQSSLGSQSDPESPLLDASRRLPIFSRLSVSDD